MIPAVESAATAAALFLVAFLYASVGHGGASGYLAVMALAGILPPSMKPTALVLNLVVAGIGSVQFARAGHFRWGTFWPFALGSIPLAFVGGALRLQAEPYRIVVGTVLLFSAVRLLFIARRAARSDRDPPLGIAIPLGAAVGFVSGITGVGGGIFLSPILLLLGWATPRTTAGVSAVFIVVNSLAGLAGHLASLGEVPSAVAFWAPAVAVGGLAGATLGSRRLPDVAIRRLLALVLILASVKLILGPA